MIKMNWEQIKEIILNVQCEMKRTDDKLSPEDLKRVIKSVKK